MREEVKQVSLESPNANTDEKTKIIEISMKSIEKLKIHKSSREEQITNVPLKYGGNFLVQQLEILIKKEIGNTLVTTEE